MRKPDECKKKSSVVKKIQMVIFAVKHAHKFTYKYIITYTSTILGNGGYGR